MATIILSVIMIGLVSVFVSGKKLVRHSRARMTAAELGKLFLEGLSPACIYAKNCANQTRGTEDGLDTNYTANYTITNMMDNNIYKIKVEIRWNEQNESP